MPEFHILEDITLGAWDDILNRPGYEHPVEVRDFRFLRITAVYAFADNSANCGISDCRQAHRRGFLVATLDGKETNLCNSCGRRLLDTSISQSINAHKDSAPVRARKTRLNKVLEQSDAIKGRVKDLKEAPKGANWLYEISTMFQRTHPIDLLAALKELATNKNDSAVIAAVIENDSDPSQLERIEQLQGLGIFVADIREELIDKILKPLLELEELAGNPGTTTSLPRYCRWADGLEAQFACTEHLIEEGRAFFHPENLQRLKSIPLSDVSTRFMRSVRWKGDSVITRRK